MTDPTPSTNDILSKIRAAKSAAQTETAPVAPNAAPAPTAAAPVQPAAVASAASAAVPKSTADILAAARAKASATAAATPAAPAATSDIMAAVKKQGAGTAPAAAPAKPADIMAAIRAKGGGAAATAAPAAAASPTAAASSAPAVADKTARPVASAAGLSPAEMIRAARSAGSGEPAAPKFVLPSKPLPVKPAAGKTAAVVPRRLVLSDLLAVVFSPVVVAWTSFFAALGASTLGLARFMMPNVLVEPPTKFKIGPTTDYAPGTVSTKWQAQFNIWVVNSEVDGIRSIYALSTVCTHLGCTPNWLEGEQKFKCPCHGSGFYKSGVNFEGPAPRPLERVGLRLAEDGMLEVDKSVKFQKELGQWTNSSSFVGVG